MKLAIGIPIVDTVPGECFGHHLAAVVEAFKLVGADNLVTLTPIGLCPHDYARYEIAEQAMKHECDRLLFIDDDTICPRGGVGKLMKEMDDRACVAISGLYLRRGNPYTPVWSKENDKDGKFYNVTADGGVHEIHISGLGCCLLDLQWLKKNLPKPWFKMKQDDRCTIITDDVVLFEGIRAKGGVILGDADVVCPHVGRREFIVPESAQSLRNVHADLEKIHLVSSTKVSQGVTQ